MLLDTQKKAARSSFGAVEVAAAFFRWTYRYPHPSRNEVTTSKAIFVPANSSASAKALLSEYEKNPNSSGGVVPDGTTFHLTTIGARWMVQDRGDGTQRVSVLAPFVIDGAVSPTQTTAGAVDLRVIEGRWRVIALAPVDSSAVAAGGTAFTAGC